MKWQKWGRRAVYAFIIIGFIAVLNPGRVFGAAPAHRYDPKFSSTFAVDWNLKHPSWPITDMACIYFPQESAQQAGVPAAGTNIPKVMAHEDCLFSEIIKGRATVQCGEITIKPHYVPNNPDAALIAGTQLPCGEARAGIRAIRHSANQGVA